MFINRTKELETLNREYDKKDATFSVIYGRRRVGKTALISEFIKDKPSIYLYATQDSLTIQLGMLTQQIKEFANPQIRDYLNFKTFEEAFEFISKLELDSKLVIVIDEYQNLVYKDKVFSSKLQRVWDMYLQHSQIFLILCGSTLSMIQSEVLNYSAPLYGRRTSNIHLKELNFCYIKDFIPHTDRLTQMQIYSSFGTIPKYLIEYDSELNFIENVKQNILDKNSYLYSEGNFLLKDEISDSTTYFSILLSISNGNRKIGAIASSLGVNSSYLSKYMLKLIELGFVEKEIPITEKNPSKSKMGLYKIKDKFLNFWFFYVYKNYNYLEIGLVEYVIKEIETNFNDRFVSFAFEEYIKEQILLNPTKYLSFVPLKVGRWWNHKEEIDLVAYDDEHIAFIECKWQNKVNKDTIKEQLIAKSRDLIKDKKAFYIVLSKEEYLKGDV